MALQDTNFNDQKGNFDEWCTFNAMRAFWTLHATFVILHLLIQIVKHSIIDPLISQITLNIEGFSHALCQYAHRYSWQRG
jgi:hypothetical protein